MPIRMTGSVAPTDGSRRRTISTLGPFEPLPLPSHERIGFTTSAEDSPIGGTFTINVRASPFKQLHCPSSVSTVTGHLSLRHPVTLAVSDMAAAQIPRTATSFAFAYPLEGVWHEVDKSELNLLDPYHAFAAIGGFVYWDEHGAVCGVNALSDGPGLHLIGPYRLGLNSGALRAGLLLGEGEGRRAQPVTIKKLVACGVRAFCWISPSEAFDDVDGSRWPHGAFVYFFDQPECDCLFAVAAAPQLTARDENMAHNRLCLPAGERIALLNSGAMRKPSLGSPHGVRPFEVDFVAQLAPPPKRAAAVAPPKLEAAAAAQVAQQAPAPMLAAAGAPQNRAAAAVPQTPAVDQPLQPLPAPASSGAPAPTKAEAMAKVAAPAHLPAASQTPLPTRPPSPPPAPASRPPFVSFGLVGRRGGRAGPQPPEAPFVSWAERSWVHEAPPRAPALFVSHSLAGHGPEAGEAPFVSWAETSWAS